MRPLELVMKNHVQMECEKTSQSLSGPMNKLLERLSDKVTIIEGDVLRYRVMAQEEREKLEKAIEGIKSLINKES